jgi:hypothetical protein
MSGSVSARAPALGRVAIDRGASVSWACRGGAAVRGSDVTPTSGSAPKGVRFAIEEGQEDGERVLESDVRQLGGD